MLSFPPIIIPSSSIVTARAVMPLLQVIATSHLHYWLLASVVIGAESRVFKCQAIVISDWHRFRPQSALPACERASL